MDDGGGEIYLDLEGQDLTDPIIGNVIDVGEAVSDQLALVLDPFPRTPGAKLDEQATMHVETAGKDLPANPFAAFASLKAKQKNTQ